MKKRITSIFLIITLILSAAGCKKPAAVKYCIFSFLSVDVSAVNMPPDQLLEKNSKALKPKNPSAINYTFVGWSKSQDDFVEWDFTFNAVPDDTTVYAFWDNNDPQRESYKVSFLSNTVETSYLPPSKTVYDGDRITEPSMPVANDYAFGGWFKDENLMLRWDFATDTVKENTILYAKWIEKKSELKEAGLADKKYIKWQGRTQYLSGSVKFYNTASGFEINFFGSELKAVITTSNTSKKNAYTQLMISVDGQVFPDGKIAELSKSESEIVLCEGLAQGRHTVKLSKRSEPQDSVNSVKSITTDGYFVDPPAECPVKMLFIGGSGITGHGVLGRAGEGRTSQNSSSLHAFGYLTARMFDADYQFVSNSGWGVLYGSNPTNNSGKVNLRKALDSVGIDDSENIVENKYNLSEFVPDVVVVNAGGNDFSGYINNLKGAEKTAAQQKFSAAVAEMCRYLKQKYPSCKIIWTFTDAETGVQSINGKYADIGISTIAGYKDYIFSTYIAQVGSYNEPAGANNHAGLSTHIRNSEIVSGMISEKLGFLQVRHNIEP